MNDAMYRIRIRQLTEALIEVEQMIHAKELNEGTMEIVRNAIIEGLKTC